MNAWADASPALRLALLLAATAVPVGLLAAFRADRWALVSRLLLGAVVCACAAVLVQASIPQEGLPPASPFQVRMAAACCLAAAGLLRTWSVPGSPHRAWLAALATLALLLAASLRIDPEPPALGPGALAEHLRRLPELAGLALLLETALGALTGEDAPAEASLPRLKAAVAALLLAQVPAAWSAPVGLEAWPLAALAGGVLLLHLRRVPSWKGLPCRLVLGGLGLVAFAGILALARPPH